jgi:hypothetical protein
VGFNPVVATGWSWRPVGLMLVLTGLVGGVAAAIAVALWFGSSGNPTLAIFVLVIALAIAAPAGAAAASAGWIGWFVGAKASRPALGALVGAMALAGAEASLILLPLDEFTEWVIGFGVIGTAVAAIVFFFEVRWHRAANEVRVPA